MKVRFAAGLLAIALLCTACAKSDQEPEVAYRYTGDFVSLVDQRKEPINKKMGVEYTLQMENFHPTEEVFAKYNGMFTDTSDDYRHVEITKRTRIYEYRGNTRTAVSAENIRDSGKLELWIAPYKQSEFMIEAVEIYILRD